MTEPVLYVPLLIGLGALVGVFALGIALGMLWERRA